MRLSPGDKAPSFELPKLGGDSLALDALAGRPVLLQFRRFAGCPSCYFGVLSFIKGYEALQKAGLEVVMFFHSPFEQLTKSFAKLEAPFPVLADPDHIAYKAYGVEKSVAKMMSPSFMLRATKGMLAGQISIPIGENGGIHGVPADFLVDAEGVIRVAHYGAHAGDAWLPDEALERARASNILLT